MRRIRIISTQRKTFEKYCADSIYFPQGCKPIRILKVLSIIVLYEDYISKSVQFELKWKADLNTFLKLLIYCIKDNG
ncbi:hypothetical protein SAMN05216253_103202 [Bacteroides thetaiotaomicron]|nr:hypothetical protein SAMN05216253_103202 [Bacteroides thetaiotaomicron]